MSGSNRSSHEAHRGRSAETLQIADANPESIAAIPHQGGQQGIASKSSPAAQPRRQRSKEGHAERLLTVQEAGEMLNTGERFPRRLIAERRIRFCSSRPSLPDSRECHR